VDARARAVTVVEISTVLTDDDLHRYRAVDEQVDPDNVNTLEEMRERLERNPTQRQLVAALDGQDVGIASCGEPHGPPTSYCWAQVNVLAAFRRRGIGRQLAARIIEHARDLQKTEIESWVRVEPGGVGFAEAYGFREVGRIRSLRLDLTCEVPDVEAPAGVQVAMYADLEDVDQGLYQVALEAVPDMPGPEPIQVGDYARWESHDLRMIQKAPHLTSVALIDGRVVGYAVLSPRAGGRVGAHRGTFVLRAFRGRGVARALKLGQIDAARRHGLQVLMTQNEDSNLPMRRVNARLGYVPAPDRLWMRGPVPRSD
jgi:GNAT superfamily N-acetyltransferase